MRTVKVSANQYRAAMAFKHDGADNATIARRLGVTTESARGHMRELLRLTGCSTRAALAVELLSGRVNLEIKERSAL